MKSTETTYKKDNMGLTPSQIVNELNRFIVGQDKAKKAVAIALRNRYRRKRVEGNLRNEIVPKNILMIGSTGVGKTEIARRLAKLTNSPFYKIEATKFTEVGYVGRDVESIIRDLVEIAVNTEKALAKIAVDINAREKAIERILDSLVGKTSSSETREKFKAKVLNGELDDTEIEISVADTTPVGGGGFEIPCIPGASMGVLNLGDMIGRALGNSKTKTKKMLIKDAMTVIIPEESEKLIDQEKIIQKAINLAENDGIVFIDEIDKIASTSNAGAKNAEISREGVQRDLLPLIEGTTVNTKYGPVKTDHILFIASGAFHIAKPSDLLPELQGRLPIRVELNLLTKDDMIKILLEPETSLIKQYSALIGTEEVHLEFTDAAIEKIADYAITVNLEVEDIGARRLHTILENLLEDISFEASEMKVKKIIIDDKFVENQLSKIITNLDLAKFVL
ncbi:ATP-dependent protease ATPase subunit HslU [Rickettsia prowazekii]|uniref:ATP-dependent protease ATPase subunit HslU n=2 Tax=Rickettsia prowazekii TaxID=782 RepID=HSLU_RICPR|nr:ATP-dependent protease ATPase subunit HslU [Rickettsia prowazekii]Q9ZDK8.1 RecName: Full=ATP-dependent protease ATPase subunit HslU; AltName: Full=Unfoldase HslU [Rickettsia prowazekii str. Madrid E]ADE29836.1 Heat shock protein HslVU,ATPase subunit HslU [Rickettsia prowazekii str. Rp22]AFE49137.1 ATP-dependent protease ATP-binding subunit HslU [Rickettsia prowazekii str. Chernikova]AFE49983.1 ATP-dependent protease ATP-binding subunit HslU [Rickettsia prowazekii str. Katsinyian]AFE50827.1 